MPAKESCWVILYRDSDGKLVVLDEDLYANDLNKLTRRITRGYGIQSKDVLGIIRKTW